MSIQRLQGENAGRARDRDDLQDPRCLFDEDDRHD